MLIRERTQTDRIQKRDHTETRQRPDRDLAREPTVQTLAANCFRQLTRNRRLVAEIPWKKGLQTHRHYLIVRIETIFSPRLIKVGKLDPKSWCSNNSSSNSSTPSVQTPTDRAIIHTERRMHKPLCAGLVIPEMRDAQRFQRVEPRLFSEGDVTVLHTNVRQGTLVFLPWPATRCPCQDGICQPSFRTVVENLRFPAPCIP